MTSPTHQSQAFWPLFPLFFVCLWVSVSFIISRTGWHSFATRYPARSRPVGQVYNSPITSFGNLLANYRNVVQVVFTDSGVYLYAMFLFRAFHPPFLVPWDSVKRVEKRKGFFVTRYQLDIEDAAGEIHLLLPLKVEEDLFRFYKRDLTGDPAR